jgi:ABC transporter with metal-binding/Fe-S-binding domain ATP-binding protein
MRLASLFSGGKDSTYATQLASLQGHEVTHLLTMKSLREDSWMFHTINIGLTPLLAEAQGLEHILVETLGDKEQEIEDLKRSLKNLDVEGIVTGAIASKYQKTRVDRICKDLGIVHISPLWGRSSFELIKEILAAGIEYIITTVAALGLDKSWLGRIIDQKATQELINLSQLYRFDVMGEGGEMETFVLDAPWFKSRIKVESAKIIWEEIRGSYMINNAKLIAKPLNP